MANSPPTINVLKYKGTGSVQVFPLLPTQLLGTQDGANIGTGGGPGPALETPGSGTFSVNRNVEFLDDRFCLSVSSAATGGVYRKNQGGAGQWGFVGVSLSPKTPGGSTSGLHILHPAGVPTMAYIIKDSGDALRIISTTDGASFSNVQFESTSPPGGLTWGHGIVYRNSIFWVHQANPFGGLGAGAVTEYDLVLGSPIRYNVSGVLDGNNLGCSFALHVHDNVLFLAGWSNATGLARVTKLQTGSFQTVVTDASQIAGGSADVLGFTGHPALFTDLATGDLIFIQSGVRTSNSTARAQVSRIQNATSGSPVLLDISSTVMGAAEGADKYLEGGGSANRQRRWVVNVDTDSDPVNPRIFLTTWVSGGSTETWEWKGVGAEIEAVALLAGISDDFSFPYNTVGGGHRLPRTAAIEIGDTSNPPEEAIGGTKVYFRGRGSSSSGTVTFRGTDSEGTPTTTIPIAATSLVVGTGMFVGLEAYYHLDGGGTDSSGKGLTMFPVGAVTYDTGILGLGFAGTGTNTIYLNLPSAGFLPTLQLGVAAGSQFTPFTVQAWVKPNTVVGIQTIVELGDKSLDGWRMESNGGGVNFTLHGRFFFSVATIPSGSFSHLVCTSDGLTWRSYLNGIEINTDVQGLNSLTSGDPLRIGNRLENDQPFDGIIDEVAIWSRGLSAAEVLSLYNAGAGKLLTDPTSLPTTPTISGNTIIDFTPDKGATLYSVILDVDAAGVDIGEGEVGLIIAGFS